MTNKKTTSPFLVVMALFLFFLSIYLVTPTIYEMIKVKQYDQTFETFVSELSTTSDIETLAYKYALENDAIVTIKNDTTQSQIETPIMKSIRTHQNAAIIDRINQDSLSVSVQYTFSSLSDINAILILLLPIIGVIVAIIYLFWYVNTPKTKKENYNDFYTITQDMLRLKPKARLPLSKTSKQKYDVANNINEIYELLLDTTARLDQKNKDYQLLLETSNQTVRSFHTNVNNEIKDILNEINGMINNQGRYRNHAVNLMEIKLKLERLLTQKEQHAPLPSTIHELFSKVLQPYDYLLQQKQSNIDFSFEKNFQIRIDDLLFHQAIGHLMTFIMNQCMSNSTIHVVQKEYDIIISYKGTCLTEESISQVISLDENVKSCFRFVKQLGFFIDYEQTEEKDGMQFVFHF